MEDFFIKRLIWNELAYKAQFTKKGKENKTWGPGARGGQHFYISKRHLDFFPELDPENKNDLLVLNIVTHEDNELCQAKYVWNNSKKSEEQENGRDESRINLNGNINIEQKIFFKDDIIIIKKESFNNEIGEKEEAFVVTRYREETDKSDYQFLADLLDRNKKSKQSKNYAFASKDDLKPIKNYNHRLFSNVLSEDSIVPKVVDNLLSDKKLRKALERNDEYVQKTLEQHVLRGIKERYNNQCLVTGIGYRWTIPTTERLRKGKGIEGAHIKPRVHKGEYSPANIIPLLAPIHDLFDNGIFTIQDNYTIEIHEIALNDPLLSNIHELNGKKLKVPKKIELSKDSLKHHRDEIFGNFIENKAIRNNE
jgi:predicted restriction endonuclease